MASVALPISALPRDINPLFVAQSRHNSQAMPLHTPLLFPSSPKMKRPEVPRVVTETAAAASSVTQPVTPRPRKRKSVTESACAAPETAAKKQKTKKDAKRGQSPEKTGEDADLSSRESYPDPRWMNDPQNYHHLKGHKYKYISKITNKLLDDPAWRDQAKAYQDQMKKKTGNWASLSRHLFPQHEHIPPCVNPLELIIEMILKHGASNPDDENKEPSIKGCFFRLMERLVDNRTLVNQIEQEVSKTIRDRERTTTEEPLQQDSPAASFCSGPLEEIKSPTTTLDSGSPNLCLDTVTGFSAKQSLLPSDDTGFELQEQIASPSSSHASWHGITAGSGSPQPFGPMPMPMPTTQTTGYTGNVMQNVRAYPGPRRNITSAGFGPKRHATGSPRIKGPSSLGLHLDSHIAPSPGLPSPLGQTILSVDAQEINTDFTSPVQTNMSTQLDWPFTGPSFPSQDQEHATLGNNQYVQPFGSLQDSFSAEYHTPEDHPGLTFTFGPQQTTDLTSLNCLIMDETQFQNYISGP